MADPPEAPGERRRASARQVRNAVRRLQVPRPALVHILKATLAATASWALVVAMTGESNHYFVPITSLVVVQSTASASAWTAVRNALGAFLGVLVALAVADLLGWHLWSLALIVFLGLLVGRWQRLGAQGSQVAISGLLVLTVTQAIPDEVSTYSVIRIRDVAIGALVGLVVAVAIPDGVRLADARQAVERFTLVAADILHAVADGRRAGYRGADADGWRRRAVRLRDLVRSAEKTTDEAGQAVRYRPGQRAAREAVPAYEAAVTAMDRVATHISIISRIYKELADQRGGFVGPDRWGEQVADLLDETAGLVLRMGSEATYLAEEGSLPEFAADLTAARAKAIELAVVFATEARDVSRAEAMVRRGALIASIQRILSLAGTSVAEPAEVEPASHDQPVDPHTPGAG